MKEARHKEYKIQLHLYNFSKQENLNYNVGSLDIVYLWREGGG